MPSLETSLTTYLQIDRSPITNRNYAVCLTRLITEIGPGRDIRLVTLADLVDYTARLRTEVSPASYAQYVRVIKGFFTWCVTVGYLEASPAGGLVARKPPKDPARNRAIPPGELQKLLDAVRHHRRNYAIVLFLADTGCRISGLASLRLSRLDLKASTAQLHEKGDRYHTVYFGPETGEALAAWLARRPETDHDVVFTWGKAGKPIKSRSIAAMIERTSAEYCSRIYSPHSIRHAVGHAWAKLGVPVTITQRKLGHADPRTTMNFYYPEDDEYLRSVSQEHSLAALGRQPGKPQGKIIRLEDYA